MASVSLIQTAYDYIHRQIMLGEFMPGTLLSENELADFLNMSRTPVRSAITQLEHDGLVVSLKKRGVLVKEPSLKEAMDIMEILYAFQQLALEHIETHGEVPDLKKLKECLDLQLEATEQGAYYLYVKYTLQFAYYFISILNNSAMLKMMELYIDKIVLYATINFKITPHEPHYSGNRVNQALYDTIAAKDWTEMRRIIKTSHDHNRERMIRLGRI
ncbi:GntR family transcriptional regulator [Paenibacillus sp. P36]|uniref:GntR family transcriptional regulator n=1 Tax=Paenibacillus sp. P36 TaxID=3342538 RepID=UPI0038B36D93